MRTRLRVSEDWISFAVSAIRGPRLAESINPRFLRNMRTRGQVNYRRAPATDNKSAFSRISGARARPDERNEGPKPILADPLSRRKQVLGASRRVVRILFQDVGVVDCKAILPTPRHGEPVRWRSGMDVSRSRQEERVAFLSVPPNLHGETNDHNVTHVAIARSKVDLPEALAPKMPATGSTFTGVRDPTVSRSRTTPGLAASSEE